MKQKFLIAIALLINVTAFAQTVKPKEAYPFENEIKAFKIKDSIQMPAPGGILFIGSSSIRMWTELPGHFPGKPIIMRGVGGSKIAQWLKYYLPLVVYPYKPAKIFLYVGDNDITDGATAQNVYDDFVQVLTLVRAEVPKTEFYYMSMKLSPSRYKHNSEILQGDKMIEDFIKKQKRTHYLDVNTPLLNAKASPDSVYFKPDMLHLKPNGYEKWEQVVGPYLK